MNEVLKNFRILIVPGLRDSGPDHWQSLWQSELDAERVQQPNWNVADLRIWSQRVAQALASADPRPTLLVAHSFGSLAAVHALSQGSRAAAALLVAPASPAKFELQTHIARDALPCPTILVGSGSDPWLSAVEARRWARLWDSRYLNLGDAGHINPASGYGPWPEGLNLLDELARRAQRRRHVSPPVRPQPRLVHRPQTQQRPAELDRVQFLY